ncbi:MAG: polyprenyl synthetase family protein [Spirochaetaceae bacterium]|nr:polyprenyl synthetase family protein [Spirochaetaceae bacterium]
MDTSAETLEQPAAAGIISRAMIELTAQPFELHNTMTSYWNDFPGIPAELEKVSSLIQTRTASHNPIIADGLASLFNGEGKLLRPGILLLAAGFGKKQEKHYKLAACLEMLHVATLIHDDIIDDSPLRRGKPTVHSRFGKHDAVLIGDYLLSQCFLLAAEYTNVDNARGLAKVIAHICSMEIEQNSDRFRVNSSFRRYRRKIMGKSALLFSLSCHVGAHEAGVSKPVTEKLRRIGYSIGMAFQIIDDILDYVGEEGLVRKSLYNDLKTGLVTLPLICALENEPSGDLKTKYFSGDFFSVDNTDSMIELIKKAGGIEGAKQYAASYTNRALLEITRLPSGTARDSLEKLTAQLLLRKY